MLKWFYLFFPLKTKLIIVNEKEIYILYKTNYFFSPYWPKFDLVLLPLKEYIVLDPYVSQSVFLIQCFGTSIWSLYPQHCSNLRTKISRFQLCIQLIIFLSAGIGHCRVQQVVKHMNELVTVSFLTISHGVIDTTYVMKHCLKWPQPSLIFIRSDQI